MKNIIITLIVMITIGLSVTYSNNDEGDFFVTGSTIKQDVNNIDIQKKEEKKLDEKLDELKEKYGFQNFLKKKLTNNDIIGIKNLVRNHNKVNNEIQINIKINAKNDLATKELINELLSEKRNFYNKLNYYIDYRSRKKFKKYIKKELIIFEEQYILSTKLIRNEEKINKKITNVETDIYKHDKYLEEEIKKTINERLNLKINNLKNNPTFKGLIYSQQITVIDKIILKVSEKLEVLEISQNKKNKIILYQSYTVAIEKLNNLKQILTQ